MSSVIGNLRVVLGLDSGAFQSGLNNATKSLAKIGKDMQQVGRRLSMTVTAPIVGFGYTVARVAGDFEASMNQVRAVSGATGEEFERLRDLAKELGRTTQFTTSDAADAMGFLAMAGMEVNEILDAMPYTLQLAASAQMDMATTADIVTNMLAGYGMEVEELGRVNDVLVKAFISSNTNLQQLGEAMKYAGPVASAAGVEFEEAAAALGMMGNAGIQASTAGTSLRGAISRMLNPTKSVQTAIAELNLDTAEAAELMEAMDGASADIAGVMESVGLSFTDAAGRLLPLADIIEQLEPHADNAGLFMQLFGQRAGPAMAALVSQGADAVRDLTGELRESGGTAEHVSAVQMEGFRGAMRELQSAFEGLQIAIADSGLLDFLAEMARKLASGIQYLAETNPKILRFGTIAAALAAALGPVVLALGFLVAGIAAIGIPIAAAIAGVAALTAVVVAFWPEIVAAKDAVIAFCTDAIDWIKEKIAELPEMFASIVERMTQIGRDIIDGLMAGLREKWDAVKSTASNIATSVVDTVRGVFQTQSPSKVFHEIGRNVMEGLGEGISSMAGDVQNDVQTLARDLSDLFADMLLEGASFREGLSRILSGVGGGFLERGIGTILGGLSIPGFAMGTMHAPRGLALVGERGPELVSFRGGERVTPNHELGGMVTRTRIEVALSPDLEARVLDAAAAQSITIVGAEVGNLREGFGHSVQRAIRDPRMSRAR